MSSGEADEQDPRPPDGAPDSTLTLIGGVVVGGVMVLAVGGTLTLGVMLILTWWSG